MTTRPLHAVLLPPADAASRMLEALSGGPGRYRTRDPAAGPGPAAAQADRPARRVCPVGHRNLRRAGTLTPRARRAAIRRAASRPDTALVIATSGSTGEPKGTELSAAALLASARASLRRIGAGAGERWLCCLPVFHIAGIQVLVRSLLAGADPVVVSRLEPGTLAASGCAHVAVVPTQLRRLVDAGDDLTAAATILLGGAAPRRRAGGRRTRGGRPRRYHLRDERDLRRLRLRRRAARRRVGGDRRRRPDPDRRAGAVLRVPAAPRSVRRGPATGAGSSRRTSARSARPASCWSAAGPTM